MRFHELSTGDIDFLSTRDLILLAKILHLPYQPIKQVESYLGLPNHTLIKMKGSNFYQQRNNRKHTSNNALRCKKLFSYFTVKKIGNTSFIGSKPIKWILVKSHFNVVNASIMSIGFSVEDHHLCRFCNSFNHWSMLKNSHHAGCTLPKQMDFRGVAYLQMHLERNHCCDCLFQWLDAVHISIFLLDLVKKQVSMLNMKMTTYSSSLSWVSFGHLSGQYQGILINNWDKV